MQHERPYCQGFPSAHFVRSQHQGIDLTCS